MSESRRYFHGQLGEIREDMLRLAAAVLEGLPRATDALLMSDLEAIEHIIEEDDKLDAQALLLEDRCYSVLALQQPMAGDLRSIVAAIRMISEIERSGDLIVNICKGARRMYGQELDPRLRGLIGRMSERAHQLYRFAIDSYVESDAPLAAALHDMDDVLDQLQKDFVQAIFESHAAGRIDLQVAVQLALICRFYERIGDHAVNIGERVRYIVTGALPEHPTVSSESGSSP
jgi:phosphate transport system protein